MKKRQPTSRSRKSRRLTLRMAYDKHYDKSELSPSTLTCNECRLKMWERLTDDPDARTVTNEHVAAFRQAALDQGCRPSTINGCWSGLRAIFRRLGPQEYRNPWGLGIIPRTPAMKRVPDPRPRPRFVEFELISRVYVACNRARRPRLGIPPVDWWRCLIVMALTTGLRRGDLMALKWSQLDLEAGTMDFRARKTGKQDLWPLHPVAVAHLRRLPRINDRVFAGYRVDAIHRPFQALQRKAGLKDDELFGLHDLRRTGATLVERVAPGLGREFLQHAPQNVSDVSYINRYQMLRDALEKIELPAGFKIGPAWSTKREKARLSQWDKFRTASLDIEPGADPSEWCFRPGGFTVRGIEVKLRSGPDLILLRLLTRSKKPVTLKEMQAGSGLKKVENGLNRLRDKLRKLLGIPKDHNPIPHVGGQKWTVWLPLLGGGNAT